MGFITRARIVGNVTVSGGAAQNFFTSTLNGMLESIIYQKATVSGFSTAGHMTITAAQSGYTLLSVTTTGTSGVAVSYWPRAAQEDTSHGALSYASGVTPPFIPTQFPIAQEAIKVVMTSGGAASAGGLGFTIDFYLSQ